MMRQELWRRLSETEFQRIRPLLTAKQIEAAELIRCGETCTTAAERLGIREASVHDRLKHAEVNVFRGRYGYGSPFARRRHAQ